ncbi:MAG: metallophosphoesterase [Deltaproteobacteria bacterium]|nr:metallophosphoesterase [Deltaproteobacteria bacterium]
MKIAATGDIHYDLLDSGEKKKLFSLFLEKLKAEEADALIIAGDVVGLGWKKLNECLDRFRPVAPVRMMVFGNHDYWAADKNTARHLGQMEKIIAGCGFHLLDKEPFQSGRVGVCRQLRLV